MVDPGLTGRLLVAAPMLRDPNFVRTVVLILDHSAQGALGLVLNRPTATAVDEPLPHWGDRAAEPSVVFAGGPVGVTSAICLARAVPDGLEADGWQPLFGRLGTLDVARDPDELTLPIEGLRLFAGYAGWGAGQVEGEIEAGAWFVVDAEPDDAFDADPVQLRRRILARQDGVLSALANFPADLSVN